MENKINIVELLKDCPTGMELDCTMIDNVVFEKLDFISSHHPIIIRRTDSNKTIHLTKYGQYSDEEDYKCVIFPKGKTTWEGFQRPFKDGDILYCDVNDDGDDDDRYKYVFILKEINRDMVIAHCFININGDMFTHKETYLVDNNTYPIRFATKEEKEKLFKAIKDYGYKWNPKTKTLDKLPKFKVGDRVKNKDNYTVSIVRINDEYYNYVSEGGECGIIYIKSQDDWELINKPKFRVGDRIKNKNTGIYDIVIEVYKDCYLVTTYLDEQATISFDIQDNWELVSNDFDFSKLVPFESKVLVRNDNEQRWIPAFWGGIREDGYVTTFGWSKYCVPYEGNEHLLKTSE